MKTLTARYYEALRRIRRLEHSYDELYGSWVRALDNLHDAERTVLDLEAEVADLHGHLECMTLDNHDLTREVEILTSGLRWFEGETA